VCFTLGWGELEIRN